MPSWKKVIISGSAAELSSVYAPSITGSLQGTASWAVSASHALTASYSKNLIISGSVNNVDYIDFNTGSATPAYRNGRIFWDNTEGALSVYNSEADITMQLGQENWTRVWNPTAATITNGTPVRITGTHGDHPEITKAQSLLVSGSVNLVNQILGLATHDIEPNTFGYITTQGLVRGVNTSAFNDGDTLYVGATAGQLINTALRAPYEIIPIGQVVKASPGGSGIIYVAVQQPLDFSDLSSVLVSGSYSYGDILTYIRSGSTGVWTHTNQLSGSYGLTGSLWITGSTTTDLVRITQTGTGNAFVVEDSDNPDATPFIITNTGRIGIGISSPTVQLDVSGSVEIIESASYMQDGSNVIYIAKGTDLFYANTIGGPGAGTTGLQRQTVYGYAAGAIASGSNQTAVGYLTGYQNSGSQQTAIGAAAGYQNSGSNQTAVGYAAGFQNSGSLQTAIGRDAGYQNSGLGQTVMGYQAGYGNIREYQTTYGYRAGYLTTSSFQTAIGPFAGREGSSSLQTAIGWSAGEFIRGDNQTAIGAFAGRFTTASNQTAVGYVAGEYNIGSSQTTIGAFAGRYNTGSNQTAVGVNAGYQNSGSNQTAMGENAGYQNSGSDQTAIGVSAGFRNLGINQTAVGFQAGFRNSGSNQTAVGENAGYLNSGSDNTNIGFDSGLYINNSLSTFNSQSAQSVFLGSRTYAGGGNRTNQIVIGYAATGIGSNSVVLGNDSITTTALKGFVGIGITTPTASLHITNTSTSASFLVEDETNPDGTPFVIQASGNTGVGTLSTPAKFTVSASGVDGILIGANTSPGLDQQSGRFMLGNANTGQNVTMYNSSGSLILSTGGTTAASSGTSRLFISSSGNAQFANSLGVGNADPTLGVLHVNGNIFANTSITGSALRISGSSAGDLVRITQTGAGNAIVVEDETNPDSTPFVVDSTGRVGIGTTTLTNPLQISKTSDSYLLDGLRVDRDPSTSNSAIFNAFDGAANIISNSGTTSLFPSITFRSSDNTVTNELMRISPVGLGIGITSPLASLHATGSAIISGSMTIGSSSLGPNENTLTLGARDAVNEGGQLGFNAPGVSYPSASFIDLYQNRLRVLKGTNAGTTSEVASWNMHTLQMQLPAYTSTSSFTGTAVGYLGFDSAGNLLTTAGVGSAVNIGNSNLTISSGVTRILSHDGSSRFIISGSLLNSNALLELNGATTGNGRVLSMRQQIDGEANRNSVRAITAAGNDADDTQFNGWNSDHIVEFVSGSAVAINKIKGWSWSYFSGTDYKDVLLVSTSNAATLNADLLTTGSVRFTGLTSTTTPNVVYYDTAAGTLTYGAAGGGGNAFPYTGSAQITGSLGITGSTSLMYTGSKTEYPLYISNNNADVGLFLNYDQLTTPASNRYGIQLNMTATGSANALTGISSTVTGQGSAGATIGLASAATYGGSTTAGKYTIGADIRANGGQYNYALRLIDGSEGAGKVLTCMQNLDGYASWVDPIPAFPYNGDAVINGTLSVVTGSLSVNNTLFTSTTATANVGSTTIYSILTSSYDGAWFEYVARSGSNARAGQIMSIWSGSEVNFTETTTTDFGSTSGLSLGVYIVNGEMALTASAATNGWNIKTIVRSI
jgi:hypothetical protein